MDKILEVFSDSSERLDYNLPDFQLYARKSMLKYFNKYSAVCHWHLDLEFILILDGSMEYFINGQTVIINKGYGIFVNSKRLHYGFSSNKVDCSFIVIAIHPILISNGAPAAKMYIEEKFCMQTEDFILLSPEIPWQQKIIILISETYDEIHDNSPNILRLISQASDMCASIGDHLHTNSNNSINDKSSIAILKMTEFIHENYSNKISINDIASAGAVCRTRCCNLFSTYIGQTPNNYLNKYRIEKSCEMLKETNRLISEIAIACGFQTSSYFSYIFRKEVGMMPQDYRK